MDCNRFFLEFVNDDEGNLRHIDEPTGWIDVTLNMNTPDRKLFGRNFTFSNAEVALTFEVDYDTIENGHQFPKILQYDQCYGAGACIKFYYESCGEILLLGRLNVSGAKTDNCTYYEVNIIQEQKVNLLLENEKVNADIKSALTLNEEPGYVVPLETFCLKSRAIQEKASQGAEDFEQIEDYYENSQDIQWNSTQNGELEATMNLLNLDILSDENINNNLFNPAGFPIPINNFSYSFNQEFQTLDIDINIDFGLAVSIGTNNIEDINFTVCLLHRDFEGNVFQEDLLFQILDYDTINGSYNPNSTNAASDGITDAEFENFNISYQDNIPVSQGDTLTLYVKLSGNPDFNLSPKYLRFWTRVTDDSYFNICGISLADDTEHQIPRLKDVFYKIVDYVTDGCVTVCMPQFEDGGEYYDYFLPNGYEVRKAVDIQDRQYAYNYKRAIESLNAIFAAGYQIQGDKIFIGTVTEFYKPIDCGRLDFPIVEYSVSYDEDLLLNTFEFKYKEVPKDEVNTIDEFNTSAEYALPSDKIKGECKVESEFIGSGYLLELERRKQFEDSPTESSKYDDDIFIVNGIYDDNLGKYVNRTNENIAPITDLISPETSYNIAISPLQNFSRWYPYVGSALHYKTQHQEIVTTFFEHNEFMGSAVLDSSTLSTYQIQKDRYTRDVFNDHIFEPRLIDVKMVEVPINYVLQMQDDLTYKRGYHTVKDKKGNDCEIFIIEYEYNPCKEELTLVGLKKNENYVQCQDYDFDCGSYDNSCGDYLIR